MKTKTSRPLANNADLSKLKSQLDGASPKLAEQPDLAKAGKIFAKIKEIARALQLPIKSNPNGRIARIAVDFPKTGRKSVKPIIIHNRLYFVTQTKVTTPSGRIVRPEIVTEGFNAIGFSNVNDV
jgi:hypothetical protein